MMKCLSLQSKMVLYVAIGGLFAFMGGIVYYSTFDIPELEKSEIELYSVEVIEVNNFENYIDANDPTNNCLDVAIITSPEKRTQKTIDKLKTVAGRVLKK